MCLQPGLNVIILSTILLQWAKGHISQELFDGSPATIQPLFERPYRPVSPPRTHLFLKAGFSHLPLELCVCYEKKFIAAVYMFMRALHLNLWTRVFRPVVLGELASSLTLGSKMTTITWVFVMKNKCVENLKGMPRWWHFL